MVLETGYRRDMKGTRVALVEHDLLRRQALRERLRNLSIEVEAFEGFGEAFETALAGRIQIVAIGRVADPPDQAAAIEALRESSRGASLLLLAFAPPGEQQTRALGAGADEVVDDQAEEPTLRSRLRSIVRAASARTEVRRLVNALVLLVRSVEAREPYRIEHSLRVSQLAEALARARDFSALECERIRLGGLLHDLGTMAIPDGILYKAAPLSPAETALIRAHPVVGYNMLREIASLEPIGPIVLRHHERFDGSGYPDGLRGREIPPAVQLVSIADAYDAITSARPYRPVRTHVDAMKLLEAEAARGLWDPELVTLTATVAPAVVGADRPRAD